MTYLCALVWAKEKEDMANVSNGRAFSLLPRLFGALSIIFVVLLVGFIFWGIIGSEPPTIPPSIGDDYVTEESTGGRSFTPTNTPAGEETPSATAVALAVPTETPIPFREWTWNEFYDFYAIGPGQMLLISNWSAYDGTNIFDDYPCRFSVQNCDSEEREQSLVNAFEDNNNANFYCEWACQGFTRNFGYLAPVSRRDVWEGISLSIGNLDVEPFCPQFSGTYDQFSCNEPVPRRPIVPLDDYDWTPQEREYMVEEILLPILNDGWSRFSDWPHWRSDWTREDVDRLADSYVCYIAANGHFVYGWPEYSHNNVVQHFELRFQLRDELIQLLAKPRGEKPPLCPDFEDMLGEEYFP